MTAPSVATTTICIGMRAGLEERGDRSGVVTAELVMIGASLRVDKNLSDILRIFCSSAADTVELGEQYSIKEFSTEEVLVRSTVRS